MRIDFSKIQSLFSLASPVRLLGLKPRVNATGPTPAPLRSPDELLSLTRQGSSPAEPVSLFDASPDANQALHPPIGPGTRVLIIGDSHTAGLYGENLDNLARQTGAVVETYGSCGSSPSWWYNGTKTSCGFYSEDTQGKVRRAHWDKDPALREKVATPHIEALMKRFKPDVVIVSLGANMINASAKSIADSAGKMAASIQASGAKLFWVGSPNGDPRKKSAARMEALQQALATGVGTSGTLLDSRVYTRYFGSDGVHYSGSKGVKMAKAWSQAILDEIQFGQETARQNFRRNIETEFKQPFDAVFK